MAIRYSTGAKAKKAGMKALIHALMRATTIAFVDGGGGNDSITDSGAGFVTAGFRVGDTITIKTASGTNDKNVVALSVVAGTIEVATASFTTEGSGQQVVLGAAKGGSNKDCFDFSTAHIYTSPMPASSDDAESGTLLAKITAEGLEFTGGALANGLRFEESTLDGVLEKLSTQNWKTLSCLASGTAYWMRVYGNAYITGASTTAVRFDCTIGVSGADITGSPTTLTAGKPTSIDSFSIEVK